MSEEQNDRLEASTTEEEETEAETARERAEIEKLAVERDEAIHFAYKAAEREATAQAAARQLALEREEAERAAVTAVAQRTAAELHSEEADEVAIGSMFGFYLVLGILIALLIVAVFWALTSSSRETVTIVRPGLFALLMR